MLIRKHWYFPNATQGLLQQLSSFIVVGHHFVADSLFGLAAFFISAEVSSICPQYLLLPFSFLCPVSERPARRFVQTAWVGHAYETMRQATDTAAAIWFQFPMWNVSLQDARSFWTQLYGLLIFSLVSARPKCLCKLYFHGCASMLEQAHQFSSTVDLAGVSLARISAFSTVPLLWGGNGYLCICHFCVTNHWGHCGNVVFALTPLGYLLSRRNIKQ